MSGILINSKNDKMNVTLCVLIEKLHSRRNKIGCWKHSSDDFDILFPFEVPNRDRRFTV